MHSAVHSKPVFGCGGHDHAHFSRAPERPDNSDLVDAYRPKDKELGFLQRLCLKPISWYQRLHRTRDKDGNPKSRIGVICPYYPSCSSYTADAIREHGAILGILKGAWRIAKCNPFTIRYKTGKWIPKSGEIYDPVVSGSPDPRRIAAQRKKRMEALQARPEIHREPTVSPAAIPQPVNPQPQQTYNGYGYQNGYAHGGIWPLAYPPWQQPYWAMNAPW